MREYLLTLSGNRSASAPGCSPEASARPAADGPGLSKGHISSSPLLPDQRPEYRIECWEGAGLLRVVTPHPSIQDEDRKRKHVRGVITGYSKAAQRRLLTCLSKVTDEAMLRAFMATLTYPGNDCSEAIPTPQECDRYKAHLDRLGTAFRRRWNAGIVWVLEFQERGAPHYHLLVFGLDPEQLLEVRQWLAVTWNRIVGGNETHLRAGTQCDLAKSPQGARHYLAKYLSKGVQSLENVTVGRYWGKINRNAIPFAEETVEEITPAQGIIALRVLRKYREKVVWDSRWNRLRRKAAAADPVFGRISRIQFLAMCQAFHRGAMSYRASTTGGVLETSVLYLNFVLTGSLFGRIKWPERPRSRNNSTGSLNCRASTFRDSMKRHPLWNLTGHQKPNPSAFLENGYTPANLAHRRIWRKMQDPTD